MALQCVAWANMAVNYSHEEGLANGLSHTFDGRHPCPLCKAISRSTEKEKKSPAFSVSAVKLPVFLTSRTSWIFSVRQVERTLSLAHFSYPQRHDAPSVPPPRSSLI